MVGVHTPEFPFEKKPATSRTRSSTTASNTPSPRTTNSRPGTPTATSTGPPSTSSTPRERPLHPLRRGQVRGERRGDPRAAGRSRAGSRRQGRIEVKAVALEDDDHAGDLPRCGPGRTLHQRDALARLPRLQRARQRCADVAYGGNWKIALDSATADGRVPRPQLRRQPRLPGARLPGPPAQDEVHARRQADRGRRRRQPTSTRRRQGDSQRLYNLVDLPRSATTCSTLEPEAGMKGYAFTFG